MKTLSKKSKVSSRCPTCQITKTYKVYGVKGILRLLICSDCGLVFADPAIWDDPYKQKDYYDHQDDLIYPIVPDATHIQRVQAIQRLKSSGKWLDLGGGSGETAIAAQQMGFEVTLVDCSEKAMDFGRRFHPSIRWIRESKIPNHLLQEKFEIISLFHVLEHIPDPVATLKQVHQILTGSGVMIVEVPDWGSFNRMLNGMNWQYVLDHHVNYFSMKSIARILGTCGFRILRNERRRTFAINESQPWKEPIKKGLAVINFGNIIRVFCKNQK